MNEYILRLRQLKARISVGYTEIFKISDRLLLPPFIFTSLISLIRGHLLARTLIFLSSTHHDNIYSDVNTMDNLRNNEIYMYNIIFCQQEDTLFFASNFVSYTMVR